MIVETLSHIDKVRGGEHDFEALQNLKSAAGKSVGAYDSGKMDRYGVVGGDSSSQLYFNPFLYTPETP